MGKYMIRVESMDHDEEMNEKFERGIECDGFTIMADCDDRYFTAIHKMSIETISGAILGESKLMSAAILAKAKREITEIATKSDKVRDMLRTMLGMD